MRWFFLTARHSFLAAAKNQGYAIQSTGGTMRRLRFRETNE